METENEDEMKKVNVKLEDLIKKDVMEDIKKYLTKEENRNLSKKFENNISYEEHFNLAKNEKWTFMVKNDVSNLIKIFIDLIQKKVDINTKFTTQKPKLNLLKERDEFLTEISTKYPNMSRDKLVQLFGNKETKVTEEIQEDESQEEDKDNEKEEDNDVIEIPTIPKRKNEKTPSPLSKKEKEIKKLYIIIMRILQSMVQNTPQSQVEIKSIPNKQRKFIPFQPPSISTTFGVNLPRFPNTDKK